MNTTQRPPVGGELLDDLTADPAQVALSLKNIVRSNRWFGGRSAVVDALRQLLAKEPAGRTLTLLDVGTGAGDLPRAAVAWARAHGIEIRPLGLERHPVAARLARSAGLTTMLASGESLPLRARSVDLVLVSQVAHHLEPAALELLMRECDRVARRAVIVADLRRSVVAGGLFWIGSRLLGFDPSTQADGQLSIRRGFSAAELRGALTRAGVQGRVWRHPMFRLVAAWQPAG
ncbi:MAG: methyltransferase domain-containing protein [Gemmatimonadota bacterium]